MRIISIAVLCLVTSLVASVSTFGQELEPRQGYAGWFSKQSLLGLRASVPTPARNVSEGTCAGSCATHSNGPQCCFPRNSCPDDYSANPLPRQCWPEYPPFYRCVPAGDCAGYNHENAKLTWWFIPKPQALRDALWFNQK